MIQSNLMPSDDPVLLLETARTQGAVGHRALGRLIRMIDDDLPESEIIDELVKGFIEQRSIARSNKDYAAADAVRKKLNEIGIVLEDKAGETVWRRK